MNGTPRTDLQPGDYWAVRRSDGRYGYYALLRSLPGTGIVAGLLDVVGENEHIPGDCPIGVKEVGVTVTSNFKPANSEVQGNVRERLDPGTYAALQENLPDRSSVWGHTELAMKVNEVASPLPPLPEPALPGDTPRYIDSRQLAFRVAHTIWAVIWTLAAIMIFLTFMGKVPGDEGTGIVMLVGMVAWPAGHLVLYLLSLVRVKLSFPMSYFMILLFTGFVVVNAFFHLFSDPAGVNHLSLNDMLGIAFSLAHLPCFVGLLLRRTWSRYYALILVSVWGLAIILSATSLRVRLFLFGDEFLFLLIPGVIVAIFFSRLIKSRALIEYLDNRRLP